MSRAPHLLHPLVPRLLLLPLLLGGIAGAQATPQPTRPAGTSPLQTAPASPYKLLPFPSPPPTLTPGMLLLTDLETRFQQAVAEGGGKAFATWFADDAVALNNGQPALRGRGAIAQNAVWDPKLYTLRWIVEGALMGPSGDMGYTWGFYESRTQQLPGPALVKTGRYTTVWRKEKDGGWKVVLDESSDDAPGPPPCCFVTPGQQP